MKEELLQFLKEEVEKEKLQNIEYNKKVKRIKELKKDPNVREYIQLTSLIGDDIKEIKISDVDIIYSFCRRHLSEIKENEANGIYVYLGTYQYSSEIDIIHGSRDIRVDYDSPYANYRIYWDIEQFAAENIPISQCKQFENEHTIINPKSYFKEKEYYKIQKEFFNKAVKSNQESAKKLILRKYDKLNK